jgi:DNA-binding MarR family transcriptional regulator
MGEGSVREIFRNNEISGRRTFRPRKTYTHMTEERIDDWVAAVGRLVPAVMRGLFAPPAEHSPLWDLPLPQLRALHILAHRGERTMREVAGCLGVAMSTATQIADRLERLALVERRADAADRRVVRLSLTEAGRAVMAEHARQRNERVAAAMERLTPEGREQVLLGLRLLEKAAGECAPEPEQPIRHPLWDVVTAAMPASDTKR